MAQTTVALVKGRDGTYAERHPAATKAAKACAHGAGACTRACAQATVTLGRTLIRRKQELVPYSAAHALLAATSMHHYAAGAAAQQQALTVYGLPAAAAAAVAYVAVKRGAGEKAIPVVGVAGGVCALLAWAAWNTIAGPDIITWLALVILATLAGVPYWAWLSNKRNPQHVEVALPGHLVPDEKPAAEDPFKPLGLAGATWHGARENTRSGYRATLTLPPGTNGRKVADTKGPDLAHLLDVGVDDVELLEDPHRAARVDVLVHTRDLLADPMPWPMARQTRTDLLAPIPVGLNRAGELVNLLLDGKHLLIAGESGSGKSNVLSMIAAAAALDPDVSLWGIDGKVTELPMWQPRMTAYVDDNPRAALAMLHDLRQTMARRQRIMRDRKLRNLTRADGLGRLVLMIDELARFVVDASGDLGDRFLADLLDILQVARSCGLIVVATTQRPSGDLLTGDVRAGFTYRMALKMADADGSRMVLGNDAGVDASRLDQDQRGLAYLATGPRRPRMMRAFYVDDPTLADLADLAGDEIAPPDLPGLIVSDTVAGYDPDQTDHVDQVDNVPARPATVRTFPDGAAIPAADVALWDAIDQHPDGATVEELQLDGVGFTSRTPITDRLRRWTAAGYLHQIDDRPRRWHRLDVAHDDEAAA